MYQKDAELGEKVRSHLHKLNLLGPVLKDYVKLSSAEKKEVIQEQAHNILQALCLDVEDPSIQKTAHRIAKMYVDEIFYGLDYANFPKIMVQPNGEPIKDSDMRLGSYDEMVCERGITVQSMCEHHFVPFVGKAAVAYLPGDNVVGLSKLNRVVDFFCRRPQVQERLTAQICTALQFILGTDSVAVVIEAEHLCVKLRGAKDPHSDTVTSMMMGKFRTEPALRNEFLSLTR